MIARRDHVGMIHARRCLLLPGGIGIAPQTGKRVARHVPEMGDARSGLSVPRGRRQRALIASIAIPKMDEVVMRPGMHRIHREHLLRDRIDRLPARQRAPVGFVIPDLEDEERLDFDIVGKLESSDLLKRAHEIIAAQLLVFFCLRVITFPSRRCRAARGGLPCSLRLRASLIKPAARSGLLMFAIDMPQ